MREKRAFLALTIIITCAMSIVVLASQQESSASLTPREESRESREARRSARQVEQEHYIDSLIINRGYQFNAQTLQVQPAGPLHSLLNPAFMVGVWGHHADIFLPYVVGIVPPFRNSVLNYTIDTLDNYSATRTDDGWLILFESPLFSASTYTFELEVNTRFGGATLSLSNPWQNTIEYSGTITKFY